MTAKTLPLQGPLRHLLIFLVLWQSAFRISNAALLSLIRFLRYFVLILGQVFQVDSINELASNVPLQHARIHKALGIDTDDWCFEYVVCPKCHSIYEFDDCVYTTASGCKESKKCRHIAMPEHPHHRQRLECGTILLKKQHKKKGYRLVPHKVYPYRSLKRSITKLLNKKLFISQCQKWEERRKLVPTNFLCDVYDGNIWKTFENFLSNPNSYLLSLNVDWFQPFKHTTYSSGAIYLTVQNLPRSERYKQENVILVGIMPGPCESALTINSYLSPLVEELKEFWRGVLIPVKRNGTTINMNVRLAINCVSCDIPASRKVCGFLGHFAKLACNKCLKEFNRHDYSGFERQKWSVRSNEVHREQCKQLLKETTKTSIQHAESKYGVRYSVLLALPYFDPIKFTVIDPMHNLFLGTGKHVFKVWVELEYLKPRDLSAIETKLNKFRCPHDIGRIPSNISSNYGGFTANQWKHWITIYSPVVLKGIIPDSHLRCWLLFVRACSILQMWYIRRADIEAADMQLLHFCKMFEDIYGGQYCTPNMHLHCHIMDCIKDYGPSHTFWCFAFERYNGLLESTHTNKKSIEPQLLKKFCLEQEANTMQLPNEDDFLSLLPSNGDRNSKIENVDFNKIMQMIYTLPKDLTFSFDVEESPFIKALPPFQRKVLTEQLFHQLQSVYKELFKHKEIVHMSYFYREYGHIQLGCNSLGSIKPGPNNVSSSIVMANWPSTGNILSTLTSEQMNVGEVQYYIKHSIKTVQYPTSTPKNETYIFAYVHWKKLHQHQNWFGVSAKVCLADGLFEDPDACCFMPVQRIYARCAHSEMPVQFPIENGTQLETVFVACPLPLKYSV